MADANAVLSAAKFDLLVSGIELPDGDMLDLLAAVTGPPRRIQHVFVVTRRREIHIFESLSTLPIDGVFDPWAEGTVELEQAFRSLAAGNLYWSANARPLLQECLTPTTISRLLTPTEQVIFSILGDGCDDDVAAAKLGLTPATVNSVRRDLHRKLKLQHRGELVQLAAQTGFVRMSRAGTFRPAFAMMLSTCASHKIPRAAQAVTLAAPTASCEIL